MKNDFIDRHWKHARLIIIGGTFCVLFDLLTTANIAPKLTAWLSGLCGGFALAYLLGLWKFWYVEKYQQLFDQQKDHRP